MNPTFETISAADLAQRLSSPMGRSAVRGEALAWCRADALVSGLAAALVELRDRGSLTLNLETICDHLRLGVGIHSVGKNPGYTDVSQVSREDWERTRAASGFTELYVRALNGEFSKDTKERIVGFMESLPCFSRTKALQGVEQDAKAKAQFSLATGMFVESFFMDRHFQTISAEDLAQQISATMRSEERRVGKD